MCVNNQGSISPQPMVVAPGGSANQNILFTLNGNCDFLEHGNDPLTWVYPFNFYATSVSSSGELYSFENTPNSALCTEAASTYEEFNEVGIDGMGCESYPAGTGGEVNIWYTGEPLVVFPPASDYGGSSPGFYYVMTPYPGGEGPCSAPGWQDCTSVSVYNNGEGPYPGGTVTSMAARTTLASTTLSTATSLPTAFRPVLDSESLTNGSRLGVKLDVKAGGVADSLRILYGDRQLGNYLRALVLAKDSRGGLYHADDQGSLRVAPKTNGDHHMYVAFSIADGKALRTTLQQGGNIQFGIYLRQLIRTPHEVFALPTKGSLTVTGP